MRGGANGRGMGGYRGRGSAGMGVGGFPCEPGMSIAIVEIIDGGGHIEDVTDDASSTTSETLSSVETSSVGDREPGENVQV